MRPYGPGVASARDEPRRALSLALSLYLSIYLSLSLSRFLTRGRARGTRSFIALLRGRHSRCGALDTTGAVILSTHRHGPPALCAYLPTTLPSLREYASGATAESRSSVGSLGAIAPSDPAQAPLRDLQDPLGTGGSKREGGDPSLGPSVSALPLGPLGARRASFPHTAIPAQPSPAHRPSHAPLPASLPFSLPRPVAPCSAADPAPPTPKPSCREPAPPGSAHALLCIRTCYWRMGAHSDTATAPHAYPRVGDDSPPGAPPRRALACRTAHKRAQGRGRLRRKEREGRAVGLCVEGWLHEAGRRLAGPARGPAPRGALCSRKSTLRGASPDRIGSRTRPGDSRALRAA